MVHENTDPRISAAVLIGGHATEYKYVKDSFYRGTSLVNVTYTPRRLLLISGLSEDGTLDGGDASDSSTDTPNSIRLDVQSQDAAEEEMANQAKMESTAQAQAWAEVDVDEARQVYSDALKAHKAASEAVERALKKESSAVQKESTEIIAEYKKRIEATVKRAKEREKRAKEWERRAKQLEEKAAARLKGAREANEKAKKAVVQSRRARKGHKTQTAQKKKKTPSPSPHCERGVHEAAYGAARRAGYCGPRQKPKAGDTGCRVSYLNGRVEALALDALATRDALGPHRKGGSLSSDDEAEQEDALSAPLVCSFFGASCEPPSRHRHSSSQHSMTPSEFAYLVSN